MDLKQFALVATFIAVTVTTSQANAQKKVVTMVDYGRWRTVSSTELSGDGNWIT